MTPEQLYKVLWLRMAASIVFMLVGLFGLWLAGLTQGAFLSLLGLALSLIGWSGSLFALVYKWFVFKWMYCVFTGKFW